MKLGLKCQEVRRIAKIATQYIRLIRGIGVARQRVCHDAENMI